ncbi:MAG: cellulase family glycosylhydrolase [Bacteroidales bacterium]|nr:cellulase family glycosylhydrolase [Bacteroidales bacterium]
MNKKANSSYSLHERSYGLLIRNISITIAIFVTIAVTKLNAAPRYQSKANEKHILYVDHSGVLLWKDTHKAPSFFGVNYTLPFAFDFRMMKQMGVNSEKEIDNDVYQMSRLGFNAFRLHIWDTEVSDSLGQFVDNEHARLLDYLLWKLKEHDIKAILTPMNLYDNGYPQHPTKTQGFANYISKGAAPNNPKYWPVMERYLKEFVNHVNPYTHLSYKNDPDILAIEILNEPDNAKTTKQTIQFINAMAEAVRSAGWKKPVFYNLSQANDTYAVAMTKAKIDGASFQWYPAGLVRGHQLRGNYLPYVDKYLIPYRNNNRFKELAKMVYEFSSADEPNSYIYPVMARSFRAAGFQWATQFTYTPTAIAYCNTDYQTHYLNLAYTPSKALSMLIAAKVFHDTPLYKNYGSYPEDTIFGNFYVSYKQNLSVMNTDTAFYYTNNTSTKPDQIKDLKHIVGFGTSPVVQYHGWGAYFLDQLQDGIWRLEVMPDAIPVRDPFERPSPKRYVTYIEWANHKMQLSLPNLGTSFQIKALNEGNSYNEEAQNGSFKITPGTYLLTRKGVNNNNWKANSRMGVIKIGDFVAPKASPEIPIVRHTPYKSVTAEKPVVISAIVAGVQPESKVWLLVSGGFRFKRIEMQQKDTYNYFAEIPGEMVRTGFLRYWIVVKNGKQDVTFPGDHAGSPFEWDYAHNDNWEVPVYSSNAPILLFDARKDNVDFSFNPWNKGYHRALISTQDPGEMAIQVNTDKLDKRPYVIGFQTYVGDNLSGRVDEINSNMELAIRACSESQKPESLGIILVENNGQSYRANIQLSEEFKDYKIPIFAFQPDSMLLLPRPYPGFLPYWFKDDENKPINLKNLQSVQFIMGPAKATDMTQQKYGFDIESVWVEKK